IHLLHLPGIFQGSSDHPRVWAQLLPVLLDPALGESEAEASCPQCRETVQQNNLIPNGQQANFLQLIKNLSILGRKEEERKGGVCEEHQEPLKLFCKVHEAPICVVCDRSRIHENHKVIPLKEALEEYKGEICSSLEILRKERGEILAHQAALDKESKDLLKLTETERLKIVEKFRELRQFLEEQEKRLLTHVEEVEKEIAGRRDEQLARLSRKLSSLEEIIQEMEEKSQQPASELLQDMRSTLERYGKRESQENPLAFFPELKKRISEFCDINNLVEDVMEQFEDALLLKEQLQEDDPLLRNLQRAGAKPMPTGSPSAGQEGILLLPEQLWEEMLHCGGTVLSFIFLPHFFLKKKIFQPWGL
uniref:B box-type domain-containing protein n=1 Tax=Podarcis muralis TaxID=64176 RepID=A0A670HNJ9_PODMU